MKKNVTGTAYLLLLVASAFVSWRMLTELFAKSTDHSVTAAVVNSRTTEQIAGDHVVGVAGDPGMDEETRKAMIRRRVRELIGEPLGGSVENTESSGDNERSLSSAISESGRDEQDADVRTDRFDAGPASAAESLAQIPAHDVAAAQHQSPSGVADRSEIGSLAEIPSVRQQTTVHPQMLTPGNFEYVGGFRPPLQDAQENRFSYGGWAVTYWADGDPRGPQDGFPGSLYIVGHRHHQLVAEIDIPGAVISERKSLDDLPVARVLQPLSDITGGIRSRISGDSTEPFEIGGLQIVNDRLHWTLYKYYNVEGNDYYSHGASSLNLRKPEPHGLWHLGPVNTGMDVWHSYKNAGYICDVPQNIADRYLGGKNLLSGLQICTGLTYSSQGPALYAYQLPPRNTPHRTSLDAVPLLWYSMNQPVRSHHYADRWTGAAWLTSGNKHTVVVVGRKAHGPVYYGPARPGDCYPDKGYHGSSYEVQMLFYAPGDLIAATRRAVADVQPWYRWNSETPGGGIDRFMFKKCGRDIGGMALDRQRNLLYIVEVDAGLTKENEWETMPVIHVFRIVD